jgi:hypothetical protein
MPRRRKHPAPALAAGLGLAALHAGVTLWYRWPLVAAAAARGTIGDPETIRMVGEKTGAMLEGATRANLECLRIAGEAATGRLDPAAMLAAPVRIASAGLQPAFKRVRANARRLNRRK